jgi:hypothetical protein
MSCRPLAVLFLLSLAACSGGAEETPESPAPGTSDPTDSVPDPGPSPDPEGEVSVPVDAESGGTVQTEDGATLSVPPGSLASDTTLTVAVSSPDPGLPDVGSVVGSVYDFGPDGTTFDPAATLALPLVVAPGTDQVAVISWLDESTGAWVDLPTAMEGGVVTAPVEHFTTFVVRIVGAAGNPVDCTYDGGCGGDPVGTWTIDGICLHITEEDGLPSCIEIRIDAEMSGTVTFAADQTYQVNATLVGSLDIVFMPGCLDPSMSSCDEMDDPEDGSDCSGDPQVECVCSSLIDDVGDETGTWSASGSSLIMDEAPDESYDYGPSEAEFCVSGDTMQLLDLDEGTVITLTR